MDNTNAICKVLFDWIYHLYKFGDPFKLECDCEWCELDRKED